MVHSDTGDIFPSKVCQKPRLKQLASLVKPRHCYVEEDQNFHSGMPETQNNICIFMVLI